MINRLTSYRGRRRDTENRRQHRSVARRGTRPAELRDSHQAHRGHGARHEGLATLPRTFPATPEALTCCRRKNLARGRGWHAGMAQEGVNSPCPFIYTCTKWSQPVPGTPRLRPGPRPGVCSFLPAALLRPPEAVSALNPAAIALRTDGRTDSARGTRGSRPVRPDEMRVREACPRSSRWE